MQNIGLLFNANALGLAAGVAFAIGLAAAPSSAWASTPHLAPTNWPGVYAYTQPPASFDPLTASDAELADWGFPPRPGPQSSADDMQRWLEATSPKLLRVVPQLVKHEGVRHAPVSGFAISPIQPIKNITAANSNNWSGVVLVPAAGANVFFETVGRWVLPTVEQAPGTCNGGWDYSSEWVGVGGFQDGFLLQAGSAANAFCDVGANIPEYYPWVEWLPASELVLYKSASTLTLFPFQPGDNLVVGIWATAFTGGVSKTGNLSFSDVTQGWTASLVFSAASVGGSEVTGKSAEWIVERTQINGSFATLPDYVSVPWVFTEAIDVKAGLHYPGSPGGSSAFNLTMVDNSKNPQSFVDIFGTNALWFFPEGSANK